ncbi:MAG: hypothetical protein IJI61_11010 [Oscillospiraceae bacterium]|nr:hypothetical protein [Oscillospiraceae bacterium]
MERAFGIFDSMNNKEKTELLLPLQEWKKERMIACTCIGCGRLLGKLGRNSRMLQKCGKCRIEMSFYIDDQYVMTVFPGWPKKAG